MMPMLQDALGIVSGSLVGFSLGLIGGGGSILAVPLILYVAGVDNPHTAIGTSAVAVTASAAINLANHARRGSVKWHCALVFASAGIIGAYVGSLLGQIVDGQKLLFLFSLLMMVVGILMLRQQDTLGDEAVSLNRGNFPALLAIGFCSGSLSGFFGIGGGFLIVPGLMLATGMPIFNAVGSSLVAVTAFGLTTATSYAIAGLIDWRVASLFLAGGVTGGLLGAHLSRKLADRRGALTKTFVIVIFAVAIYMLFRTRGVF